MLSAISPARADATPAKADLFFLGKWQISSAVVAPWSDPAQPRSEAEKKSLLGKTITFEAKRIRGPHALACQKPIYNLVDSTPLTLFQGAFEELHDKDPSADPDKLAAQLGFKDKIRSLETGCGNELDFHFVDSDTAEFGLNDFIYTLKRDARGP